MTDKLVRLSDVEAMIKKEIKKMDSFPFLNYYEGGRKACEEMLLSSLSSLPTQNEGGDRTDADIVFDIKSDT